MYTACPSCKYLYRIHADHLRAAGGKVRCSNCGLVFSASLAVFETAEDALRYAESADAQGLVQEIDASGRLAAQGMQEAFPDTVEETSSSIQGGDLDLYAQPVASEFRVQIQRESASEARPDLFLEEDLSLGSRRVPWGAIAACLLLILALIGQYAYVERNQLAQTAQLRPAMELFCQALRCDLPLRHDPAKVEVLSREVHDHPRLKEVLVINAVFINRADFIQAFPLFQVTFSDVSGTPIALRQFRPQEYLRTQVDQARGMPPGEEMQLMLEVIDPGARAVSFQFDFL